MSIIVTQDGQRARRIEASGIFLEASLQDYIVANPEALPLADLRDDLSLLIVAREFPTASGPIDAVGIDDEGRIYLIETKLYRNPDKRRVLAQVMDYGAALWRRHGDPRSFRERLEDAARKCHGKDLAALVCDRFPTSSTPEDVESLLVDVETAVSEGRFRFVVLMDHIDDALKDLISYINENSRFDVFGVELQFYRFDGYEVTIPKLYGGEARKEVPTGSKRRTWDEATFFEDAEQDKKLPPEHLGALRRLHEFVAEHADRVTWGTGAKVGSFNPKYDRISRKSLFTAESDGSLWLNFDWLRDEENRSPEPVVRLASRFRTQCGFDLPEDVVKRQVKIPAEVWVPQVETIISAMQEELRNDGEIEAYRD